MIHITSKSYNNTKDAVIKTASFQANTYSIVKYTTDVHTLCTISIITLLTMLWNSKYHNVVLW